MCNYFSFLSDGKGKIFYFNSKQREELRKNNPKNYETDSHTSIAHFYGYEGKNEDTLNKWEYNLWTKILQIDQLNAVDDRELFMKELEGIDFNKINFVSGSLYLKGCDLKGIKLPSSIGGYLYLSGCDLKGIKLPSSVGGYLDLRGCDLKGVNIPEKFKNKIIN